MRILEVNTELSQTASGFVLVVKQGFAVAQKGDQVFG